MSDTMSDIDDVEDVLSSIRRLVSETTVPPTDISRKAPEAEIKDAVTVDLTRPAPKEALILTSAQRVDQVADAGTDTLSGPMMADTMRRAVEGAFEEEQRQFLAEDSAALDAEDIPDAPETRSEALSETWPNRPPEDYYEDEADKPEAEPAFEDDTPSDEWSAKDETSDSSDPELTEDEHAEEAAVWIDPAFEDEALQFNRQATAEIHHFDPTMTVVEAGWTDDGEIIDASEIEAVDEDDLEEVLSVDDSDRNLDDGFEDAVEVEVADELEDKLEDEADTDADADAPPGIAAFLRGNPEEAVRETGRGSMFSDDYDATTQTEGDAASDVDLGNLDETTLLDEEALRDMVAEIVREELTGDMGERITRNVRKLVRREIHRALMTREFD